MKISSKQKKQIIALNLVKPENYEHFFDILEGDLSHNHAEKERRMTSSVRDQKQATSKIIKATERLLELLDHPSAESIRTSASQRIASRGEEPNYRWNSDLASEYVATIREAAFKKQEDLTEAVGTRYSEQSLLDIICFWQDFMKRSIRPITPNGQFVKFGSILMSQDSESTCRAVQRLLRKQPELDFPDSDTTKPTKKSPELS
jgi:hypothetical protein